MSTFDDVQRIVLRGTKWKVGCQLMLCFESGSPLSFINDLSRNHWPTADRETEPAVQVSLGFTRRGLERVDVPQAVLAKFAFQAPAFWAGAALRAADFLRMTGENAPERWPEQFAFDFLDAVLSVHASNADELESVVRTVKASAQHRKLHCQELPRLAALSPPPKTDLSSTDKANSSWVHFGYRDGLSRVVIRQIKAVDLPGSTERTSMHEAGEFLLGHIQDCGANPWIAGPARQVWPEAFRAFFHNGSFGIVQQIEQRVEAFDAFVEAALPNGLDEQEIRGKLCGRYPDGRSLAAPKGNPEADFDYADDPLGVRCPYGSHARRMNPRLPPSAADRLAGTDTQARASEGGAGRLAMFSRRRPLLRRGLSYGTALWEAAEIADPEAAASAKQEPKGLVGQFFCGSIEDQYEHLLGEWGDRVAMGSRDGGGARDPFMGAHQPGDGPFEIPRPSDKAIELSGLTPFIRTIGAAYLFYPSLTTLHGEKGNANRRGIAGGCFWDTDDLVNAR
jgi:deferrochelatase/peroxidase EfeB